ncbi:hypothetical protein T484DRAFT_1799939, partial [Baffinella frigidus]
FAVTRVVVGQGVLWAGAAGYVWTGGLQSHRQRLGKDCSGPAFPSLSYGFAVTPAAVGQGLLWACIPLVVMNVIGKFEFDAIKEVQLITDAFARKLFLKRSVWQILLFSFAAGFGEELLFRGAIQQKLCLLVR